MIAAYMRVSTKGQANRETIEGQRKAIERYSKQKGITVDEELADDGKSSRIPLFDRPKGHRLLELAQSRQLTELLVYYYDRLGRDEEDVDTLVAMSELRKLGVTITSLNEPAADTPLGRLIATIGVLTGGIEREKIRVKTRQGSWDWAPKNIYLGGIVKFGWKLVDSPNHRDRKERAPADDPMPGFEDPPVSEHDVIGQIFEKIVTSSQPKVADWLNRRGIPLHPAIQSGAEPVGKRAGKRKLAAKWTAQVIGNIIRDPAYKGCGTYGKLRNVWTGGKVKAVKREDKSGIIDVSYPALVPAELWERANAAMRGRVNPRRAHAQNRYLLTDLMTCSICGSNYIGRTKKTGLKLYHCNKHYGYKLHGLDTPCPGKNVNGTTLEGHILDDLKAYLQRPPAEVIRDVQAGQSPSHNREAMAKEIKRLERLVAGQDAECDRVLSLRRKGVITEAQLEKQYAEMDAEKTRYTAEIEHIRRELNDADAEARKTAGAIDFLTSLRGRMKTFEDMRKAAQALVRVVVRTGDDGRPCAEVTYLFEPVERRQRDWAYDDGYAQTQTLAR